MLTDGVLWGKVDSVCVEKLQEGTVDGVRELANLYHVLLILSPLGVTFVVSIRILNQVLQDRKYAAVMYLQRLYQEQ